MVKLSRERLMVQIGKDNEGNPIFKRVKKLIVHHFDMDNVLHKAKAKPFYKEGHWFFNALGKVFFISDDCIFFDEQKRFWVMIKNEKDNL